MPVKPPRPISAERVTGLVLWGESGGGLSGNFKHRLWVSTGFLCVLGKTLSVCLWSCYLLDFGFACV